MTDAKYYTELADQDLDGALREETADGEARRLAAARVHAAQANAEAIEHLAQAIERLADVVTTAAGPVP